ncbi:MAG: hypothetical protein R3F62_04540 [Planctomycetota bacterium]
MPAGPPPPTAAPAPPVCPVQPTPQGWTRLELAELGLIAAGGAALPSVGAEWEWAPRLGAALGYAAALVLGQGLLRDLVRLAREGRKEPTRVLPCLCAETSLGLTTLGVGVGLLCLGIEETVRLTQVSLTVSVGALLLLGFLAKDYVLVLRKERDHGSVRIG